MMTDDERPVATIGHLDPRLRTSLRIFAIVAAAMVVASAIDTAYTHALPIAVVACGAVGLAVGWVLSRTNRIRWDESSGRLVSAIDAIGAVILIAYIALMFLRGRLLAHWLPPFAIWPATLSLMAGVMIGRLQGSVMAIRMTLRALGFHLPRRGWHSTRSG
jgi:hypothetical protein